jgi:hypothetical protein
VETAEDNLLPDARLLQIRKRFRRRNSRSRIGETLDERPAMRSARPAPPALMNDADFRAALHLIERVLTLVRERPSADRSTWRRKVRHAAIEFDLLWQGRRQRVADPQRN